MNSKSQAKTEKGAYQIQRIKEKQEHKGDYTPPEKQKRCILDPRYICNPTACPPIREQLANIRTTGERRPCHAIPAE
jgi:hypothetical protein